MSCLVQNGSSPQLKMSNVTRGKCNNGHSSRTRRQIAPTALLSMRSRALPFLTKLPTGAAGQSVAVRIFVFLRVFCNFFSFLIWLAHAHTIWVRDLGICVGGVGLFGRKLSALAGTHDTSFLRQVSIQDGAAWRGKCNITLRKCLCCTKTACCQYRMFL